MRTRSHGRDVPESIEQVRRRFEDWRRSRGRSRRIPEHLWDSAVEVAEQHGVHRAGLALRLNPDVLKQRVVLAGSGKPKLAIGSAAFVEIAPAGIVATAHLVVELEDRAGAKMRVQLSSAVVPDLAALTRAFLRGER